MKYIFAIMLGILPVAAAATNGTSDAVSGTPGIASAAKDFIGGWGSQGNPFNGGGRAADEAREFSPKGDTPTGAGDNRGR